MVKEDSVALNALMLDVGVSLPVVGHFLFLGNNVADPDQYVLGLPDPDLLVRGTDPYPSIIKKK
jgi:hypothetical protein